MNMVPFSFSPTRASALSRLDDFAPRTGRHYAANRNTDEGPGLRGGVSMLSPYVRFRMIAEEEILTATLQRHTFSTAEKFVQEVFWRGYFKGFLETRPKIWNRYLRVLDDIKRTADYDDAIAGRTGIECFDCWVSELKQTGYMHNHARMWFASIWIFTLRLPWQLGADFMYRHLIDGDPASNTLSWRWVGGIHTKGKTYLARPDNIAHYSNGRFHPSGLATSAPALEEDEALPVLPVPLALGQWPEGDFGLLVTTEDVSVPDGVSPLSIAIPLHPLPKPGGEDSALAMSFKSAALQDAADRFTMTEVPVERIATLDGPSVLGWCQSCRLSRVATAYAPVGPEASALDDIEALLALHDISLLRVRRRYDSLVWPHATKGFFALKEKIPMLLQKLNLQGQQAELF
jgi:deoxyribodipyrimidine photo-lyase